MCKKDHPKDPKGRIKGLVTFKIFTKMSKVCMGMALNFCLIGTFLSVITVIGSFFIEGGWLNLPFGQAGLPYKC